VSRQNGIHSGKTILVTGAGGGIGAALAKRICDTNAARVLLLDHSEQNLCRIHSDLTASNNSCPLLPILGDVSDQALLDEVFEKHRPDAIFHAAAFKHVALMESNPVAVIRNNILGTWTLARAAVRHRVCRLLMISTDKAVNARSIMGATKRVAEIILLGLAGCGTRLSALRLGNVRGSHGSVIPLFQQQMARGGPVPVTHPEWRRYFLSLADTVELILAADSLGEAACILVPEIGEAVKIVDLARGMIQEAGRERDKIRITFIGLRPGDKLSEELVGSLEFLAPTCDPKLRKVGGPRRSRDFLDSAIEEILDGVRARNLAALIETIRAIIPEYQPSETLLAQVRGQALQQHRLRRRRSPPNRAGGSRAVRRFVRFGQALSRMASPKGPGCWWGNSPGSGKSPANPQPPHQTTSPV
jgi:FlaA1/EpsC-like NDP-sugar epimerase